MAERFDAVVIGTGQAGPALCARLDREGLKTALIERKLLGGTCVNNGCIPTKTLVASARAARMARRAGEYGVELGGEVRVDMKAVKARKDAVVGHSSGGLEKWIAGVTVVEKLPRLIAREDEDVSEEIRAILEREGIAVRTGAECMAVSRKNGGIAVGLECQEGAPHAEGTHLLLALGRKPNTDDLGLEKTTIQVD